MSGRKLAVVTGATGGIGSAICQRLAADGYAVVAHYRGNEDRARELASLLGSVDRHFIRADLSCNEGVTRIVEFVEGLVRAEPEYELRALVNNAAKLLGPSFEETTPAQFDEYFSINTKAPFLLTQRLSSHMLPGSSVVNISSASAHFSSPGDIVYAMTKAALENATRNMAEPLAARGVHVNNVVPGFTDNGHAAFSQADAMKYMSSFSVMGDVAAPEVVAEAVAFLVSDKASRTTGSTIDVSGGSTLSARGERAHGIGSFLR